MEVLLNHFESIIILATKDRLMIANIKMTIWFFVQYIFYCFKLYFNILLVF